MGQSHTRHIADHLWMASSYPMPAVVDDAWVGRSVASVTFVCLCVCLRALKDKKLCSYAEGPCDVPQIRNIALEKAFNSGIAFKDTQGHYNCCN